MKNGILQMVDILKFIHEDLIETIGYNFGISGGTHLPVLFPLNQQVKDGIFNIGKIVDAPFLLALHKAFEIPPDTLQ